MSLYLLNWFAYKIINELLQNSEIRIMANLMLNILSGYVPEKVGFIPIISKTDWLYIKF